MIQEEIRGSHGKLKILKLNDKKLYYNEADCPPAPPMRPWRWGNDIGLRPSRRPSTTAAPMQPPKGLPKCYLYGWFAAESPPAPPMRPWCWGNDIGLRPKPPPQHHGRPDAAPQGASQMLPMRLICGG